MTGVSSFVCLGRIILRHCRFFLYTRTCYLRSLRWNEQYGRMLFKIRVCAQIDRVSFVTAQTSSSATEPQRLGMETRSSARARGATTAPATRVQTRSTAGQTAAKTGQAFSTGGQTASTGGQAGAPASTGGPTGAPASPGRGPSTTSAIVPAVWTAQCKLVFAALESFPRSKYVHKR